jgi:hypothetical protein
MEGRQVKTITQQDFAVGSHTISFDVTDLSAGVFLVQLSGTTGEITCLKMIRQ